MERAERHAASGGAASHRRTRARNGDVGDEDEDEDEDDVDELHLRNDTKKYDRRPSRATRSCRYRTIVDSLHPTSCNDCETNAAAPAMMRRKSFPHTASPKNHRLVRVQLGTRDDVLGAVQHATRGERCQSSTHERDPISSRRAPLSSGVRSSGSRGDPDPVGCTRRPLARAWRHCPGRGASIAWRARAPPADAWSTHRSPPSHLRARRRDRRVVAHARSEV